MKRMKMMFWTQTSGQTFRLTRWLSLPQFGAWLVRCLVRQSVTSYGWQQLPDKPANEDVKRLLRAQFESVISVWAIWPVGAEFYESVSNQEVVERLILPNPDSKLVRRQFGRLKQRSACALIRSTTANARRAGTQVRWIDNFLFNAITIANYDKPNGWAQIEAVCRKPNGHRPGLIIFKDGAPDAINKVVDMFCLIWDFSKEPPASEQ